MIRNSFGPGFCLSLWYNRLKNKYSQKDFLRFVKQIYEFKNLIEFKV